jgi:hypothetical protein
MTVEASFVEVRPAAAHESAALVLLRPARPRHDSVNGDLRGGRQLHGRSFLLAEFVLGWLLNVVTTARLWI